MRARQSACPNPLHNWPLPSAYLPAAEMADRRLATGWGNTRCPDCGIWGWTPGALTDDDIIALPPKEDS